MISNSPWSLLVSIDAVAGISVYGKNTSHEVGILRLRESAAARRFRSAQDDKTPTFSAREDKIKPYARDRYAPSDVSTLIFSPSLMKGGT
jgi:hypothetical protein